MAEPADLVRLVQDAVDRGARTAEEVHLSVAALPLDALRSLGASEDVTGKADDLLQTSIGGIYDAILAVNRRVGEIAADVLEQWAADGGAEGS